MGDPGLDVQHFALAQSDFVARALQQVGLLLGVVHVLGNDRAALQVDLCYGLAFSGDELARNHFRDFFEGDLVPAEQTIGMQGAGL